MRMTGWNIYQFKVFKMQKVQMNSKKYSHLGNFTGRILLTNSKSVTEVVPVTHIFDHLDQLPLGTPIAVKNARALFNGMSTQTVLDRQMYELLIVFLKGLYAIRHNRSDKTIEKLPSSAALPSYLHSMPGQYPSIHFAWNTIPPGMI